ncbi:hypothetical protein U9M48_044235 [Paspalum notatum var. saurae]|uniref:tRNA synthetases class I catalytic domain-containing protein n=1 Tax=Paspalum notatum var. saurae TaxID=547442 RepID=A0AAQ3UWL5_PASNO
MAQEVQALLPTTVAEPNAPPPTTVAEPNAPPQLELFNSMTKRKEPFQPRVEGKVSMYVCGVTPYDFSHIGHARAYVAFDVLYREH